MKPQGPIRLLLVEGDPDEARRVFRALDSGRFSVETACSLREASLKLKDNGFEVVVLDLIQPDGCGIPALKQLQRFTGDLPVVVITGIDDQTLAVQAVQAGAQDYLVRDRLAQQDLERIILSAMERQRLVVELKLAREREHFLATHDPLTRLPNRQLFYDRLGQALVSQRRQGGVLGVLFLDLDRFKPINDRFGHPVGDELLRLVAERLQSNLRESDTPARIGGDEFTVLLRHLSHPGDAALVAEKILKSISLPFRLQGEDITVGASLGVAVAPGDGESIEDLIRNADRAMYAAKERGGNRYCLFRDLA